MAKHLAFGSGGISQQRQDLIAVTGEHHLVDLDTRAIGKCQARRALVTAHREELRAQMDCAP